MVISSAGEKRRMTGAIGRGGINPFQPINDSAEDQSLPLRRPDARGLAPRAEGKAGSHSPIQVEDPQVCIHVFGSVRSESILVPCGDNSAWAPLDPALMVESFRPVRSNATSSASSAWPAPPSRHTNTRAGMEAAICRRLLVEPAFSSTANGSPETTPFRASKRTAITDSSPRKKR